MSRDKITPSLAAEIEDASPETVREARVPTRSEVVPKGSTDGLAARPSEPAPRREPQVELYCPFDWGLNPYVELAQSASVEWAAQVGLAASEDQQTRLERARLGWLGALVFHSASPEVLRLAADWTTLFCAIDDHVEQLGLGPLDLSVYLSGVLDDFRGEGTGSRDALGRAFRDLHGRMLELAGPRWTNRFAADLEELFEGYLWEEVNRDKHIRPSYGGYRTMRAVTIGLRPQFLLGELALGIDLGERAARPAELRELEDLASLSVGWANDIFTHEKELRQGEVHNLVLVLMDEEGLSLMGAIREAAAIHDEEVRRFLGACAKVDAGARTSPALEEYRHMLGQWIRGHMDWARETGRYQEKRTVSPIA